MANLGINHDLVSVTGARARLQTPALVLDLDAFERNLARMAMFCRDSGISLRPHAKTHKCAEIAKRQMAAGALGICCAKLGEAEVLATEGISAILLTSPVVTPRGIDRVVHLNGQIDDLMVVVDNPLIAETLATAVTAAGQTLTVLLDLDVGLHRTGMAVGDAARDLAWFIQDHAAFDFAGLQAYAGHVMHIEEFDQRREASLACLEGLRTMRDRLIGEGLTPRILTGGGTGTFNIDPDANVLTELQGGSYIFMDAQYNDVDYRQDVDAPFETSLFVATTVISANAKGIVTTDAGFKALASDADAPVIVDGAPEGARYFFFGDEQGGIAFADKQDTLSVGDQVLCVTPHCDPTVNLYDFYHCVRGDTVEAIWLVDARGRAQ